MVVEELRWVITGKEGSLWEGGSGGSERDVWEGCSSKGRVEGVLGALGSEF